MHGLLSKLNIKPVLEKSKRIITSLGLQVKNSSLKFFKYIKTFKFNIKSIKMKINFTANFTGFVKIKQGICKNINKISALLKNKILESRFYNNLNEKQRNLIIRITAAASSIIVFFIIGVFAVTATPKQEDVISVAGAEPNAVMVVLDGNEAGYIACDEQVDSVIGEICSKLSEEIKMEAKLTSRLELIDVTVDEDQTTMTDDELKDVLTSKGEFKYTAYALMVDGKEIGVLKTEKDFQELLDKIKKPYFKKDKKLEVSFAEDVQIVEKSVEADELGSADEIYNILTENLTGQKDYTVKEGDTIWDIALKHGTDEETIFKLNPELSENDYLMIDQKIKVAFPKHVINVVTSEVVEYEAPINYKTEKQDDNSLYTNQSRIIRNGKEGVKKVKAKLIKKNGIEQEREVLEETVIKKPVSAIVANGTREIPRSISRSGGMLNWPARGSITSCFGWRWGKMHQGIDIANSRGTPVYAADPGTVTYSGYRGGYGILVIVDHGGGGFVTYYGHLQSSAVNVGDTLARGELLGYMGSTGDSTGNHVHFEVRLNNQPVDPMRYLD